MTTEYKDILLKLESTIQAGLANEQMRTLATLLRDRSDREISRILEDKGDLRILLRSYYR